MCTFFIICNIVLIINFCFKNTHSLALPVGANPRLTLNDWAEYYYREQEGPGSYSFGYEIENTETNNIQFRSEERYTNGTVSGSYGYVKPDGSIHIVHYTADAFGYRTTIENSAREVMQPHPSAQMISALNSLHHYGIQNINEHHQRPLNAYEQMNNL